MALSAFQQKRKYEMARELHEVSTTHGFRGYVLDEYDTELLKEISRDMEGDQGKNMAFNIFCLGFYRGRLYEKERYVEKAPGQRQTIQGHSKTGNGLT